MRLIIVILLLPFIAGAAEYKAKRIERRTVTGYYTFDGSKLVKVKNPKPVKLERWTMDSGDEVAVDTTKTDAGKRADILRELKKRDPQAVLK
jgi:hypothetical protein